MKILLPFIVSGIVGALGKTISWKFFGQLSEPAVWNNLEPKIFLFWHGKQILMPALYKQVQKAAPNGRFPPVYTLISQHRDGRLIADAVRRLGFNSVAGSSTRNARAASRELIDILSRGASVAITPDGPKGPRCQLKIGALKISQLSNVPIHLLTFASKYKFSAKSWDKFEIPAPFFRVYATMSEPYVVPKDLDGDGLQVLREKMEVALNSLTYEMEQKCL